MNLYSIACDPSLAEKLLAAAKSVADQATQNSIGLDQDFAFPYADVAALNDTGLLVAPFSLRLGGAAIATGPEAVRLLLPILRQIGAGSLPLGRLYEGHINAVGLVLRFGTPTQAAAMATEAHAGALFGVWAADDACGLRLLGEGTERRLAGRKILCSGASFIQRPLVTAKDEAGCLLMMLPKLEQRERTDLSGWTAQGMRASATGTVDFDGVRVGRDEIIGHDDDYHLQPAFSGGAWRFAAVQQGAMEALLDGLRDHLARTQRGGNPHQAARLGEATIEVETARLWVERAAVLAEASDAEPEAVVAYVNLARTVVERAALDLMELVHRSIGLASFLRPNPIERISRDLATYLRQPGPDKALTSAAAWVLGSEDGAHKLW